MKRKLALIAFGGNALLPAGEHGLQQEQQRNAERAARLMVHVVRKGYDLIIVHGNGPQVGNLLIQMEEAVTKVPALLPGRLRRHDRGEYGLHAGAGDHQRAPPALIR